MNAEARSLLVADSFRVRLNPATGRSEVRGWSEHLNRFRRGVSAAVAESNHGHLSMLEGFLKRAAEDIAAHGEGFPRLELWDRKDQTPELVLSLRPLPKLGTDLAMRSAPGTKLQHAERKGPNITLLSALNQRLGAETLLLDALGQVLEGATTSLIWWGPNDTDGHVVAPAQVSNRVDSVTEGLVSAAAQQQLTGSRITAEELTRYEVWAVNALHGIRVVTAINEVPTRSANTARLNWFREALDRRWEPVYTPSV